MARVKCRPAVGAATAPKNGLIPLAVGIFGVAFDFAGQRCLAEFVHGFHKLVVVTVEQKADGAATRRGIINHFGNEVTITEVEFVANTNFAGGVHQHIPQFHLPVQFAQEENFNFGPSFLFVAIEPRRKHFGIVNHQRVAVVEITQQVREHFVFDLLRLAVHYHQACFTAFCRILGNQTFWQVKPKFR
jgi:hypothetical protein